MRLVRALARRKAEPMSETKFTPRQKQVLDLMREIFGDEMEADKRNYRKIADRIGWQETSSVRFTLYCLRAKGAIVSVGPSTVSPERWVAR